MLWKTVGAVCRRGVGVAPEVVGVMVVRGWGMSRGVRHGGARSVAVGGFSVAGSFLRLSTVLEPDLDAPSRHANLETDFLPRFC